MTRESVIRTAEHVFSVLNNVLSMKDTFGDGMTFLISTTDDEIQLGLEAANWVREPLGDINVIEYNSGRRYNLGVAHTADDVLAILRREHGGFLF